MYTISVTSEKGERVEREWDGKFYYSRYEGYVSIIYIEGYKFHIDEETQKELERLKTNKDEKII